MMFVIIRSSDIVDKFLFRYTENEVRYTMRMEIIKTTYRPLPSSSLLQWDSQPVGSNFNESADVLAFEFIQLEQEIRNTFDERKTKMKQ